MEDDGEGSDLPQEEMTNKEKQAKEKEGKGKKRGRNSEFIDKVDMQTTQSGTRYASYEDFAHLLEEGLDGEDEKPKKKQFTKFADPNFSQKRRRTK